MLLPQQKKNVTALQLKCTNPNSKDRNQDPGES